VRNILSAEQIRQIASIRTSFAQMHVRPAFGRPTGRGDAETMTISPPREFVRRAVRSIALGLAAEATGQPFGLTYSPTGVGTPIGRRLGSRALTQCAAGSPYVVYGRRAAIIIWT
jgi:hypothetical protein